MAIIFGITGFPYCIAAASALNSGVILVVDDHQDGAEALCAILKIKGFPCRWVPSGQELLSFLRAHPPEQPLLVVLDDMMPEMTGVATLKAIRADPKISTTTVIMHSAGFDVGNRDEAMTLGAVAWLYKGGAMGTTIQAIIDTIIKWYLHCGGVSLRKSP